MAQLTAITGAVRPRPTAEQHLAADPACSVWVSASAGSGKTRVLANRLVRLLLDGADPAALLCLTYTKAGAAEMSRRVQDDLARFAALPLESLKLELEHLLGRVPDTKDIGRARAALLQVLDLPAGLRVMTIHSFCQSLLRRFPLEADVSPHFELMEPRAAATRLERARDEVLINRTPAIREAIDKLAVALGEHSLAEGLSALNARRTDFSRFLGGHQSNVETVIRELYLALNIEPGITVEALHDAIVDDPAIDEPGLIAAASALASSGNVNDQKRGSIILRWLQADRENRRRDLADYEAVFLRGTDRQAKAQQNVATKPVITDHPQIWEVLEREQGRLAAATQTEKAVRTAEKTAALIRVGAAILGAYERQKRREGLLDYADLIDKSRTLLSDTEAADWVRYKLDQRIDHLLIDESQDTSPDQWAIVLAVIDDFFSGESYREQPPTLFVVGDEKQSIFGFQGADVETFNRLRGDLKTRAEAAGMVFQEPRLASSFRSAQAILDGVDAVFADPAVAVGVHSDENGLAHAAFDGEKRGLIEIWPLAEAEKPEDKGEAGWVVPDQVPVADPAELRLARSIALQIQAWIRDDVTLLNEDRPIRAGDIMILLPRRGVLQDFLVRELKRNNVPVAGADRMSLTDELAVMDLMALGDALLLPEDDLTMAVLLRSPLFGFTDEQLLKLAYDRGDRPLYRRLRDLAADDPAFAEADQRFSALLAAVDYMPPYAFFASFLSEGAPNGRARLLRRLGPAAILPIEAFLAQAIAYEQRHPPSMQGFLHWLRADNETIKRDAQEAGDEVRVLTVHGAKGLEAPIVFLADATYQKTSKMDRLLWRDDGLPIWKAGANERDPSSQAIQEEAERRQQAEHRRLLYVAMTRAEERLIIAGCKRDGGGGRGTWYDIIEDGLRSLPGAATEAVTLPSGLAGEVLRFGDARAEGPAAGQATLPFERAGRGGAPMPDWLADAARGEIGAELLRPSDDPLDDDPPAASPLLNDGQRRFGRGLLIHKLLQILPDVSITKRAEAMHRYLEKPGLALEAHNKEAIAAEVSAILDNPTWRALFGRSSRAEVPLVGEVDGRRVSGQVDRLSILDHEVIVVDFKTNRPPPREQRNVPSAYGRQMAIYRALLRQIYPNRQVRCGLLWTEGPRLMMLEDAWLDSFSAPPG